MLSMRSPSILSIVTYSSVSFRIKVDIGVDGSIPVKAVIGAMILVCGDGALFNAICTNDSRSVHSSIRILSSNTSARKRT